MTDDEAMLKISAGQHIDVRDAFGNVLRRVAIGEVDPGYDFAVVWACREDEWAAAQAERRDPDATPWPIEDVSVADRETAAA